MSDLAIRIEGLSKQYRIGLAKQRYDTLGEQLVGGLKSLIQRNGNSRRSGGIDTIWAVKDVSFDVHKGDVVGIIGRNGAGKSTLLKILSRITEPTEGWADIHGRVGSLLEVGTGFNGELTGRENIYLNGAILGMKRAEIDRKFDEIVAFSEIEKFIDTPVKRYSSGMYVRLAFAVAAHLEPEILIVDEVLAVGDVGFQKKCLGKIGDAAKEGRTVLFVSHNLRTVMTLCTRGVLMEGGRVESIGAVDDVLRVYLAGIEGQQQTNLAKRVDRKGDGRIRFTDCWMENRAGERVSAVRSGDAVTFYFEYACRSDSVFPSGVNIGTILNDGLGQPILSLSPYYSGGDPAVERPVGCWSCTIEKIPLMPDRYSLELWCGANGQDFDHIAGALIFDVTQGDFYGTGKFPRNREKSGTYLVRQDWREMSL